MRKYGIIIVALLCFMIVLLGSYISSNRYGNQLRKAKSYKQFQRLISNHPNIYVPQKNEAYIDEWEYILYLTGKKVYSPIRGYEATTNIDNVNYVIDVQLIDSDLVDSSEKDNSGFDNELISYKDDYNYRGKKVDHVIYEDNQSEEPRTYIELFQFDDKTYRYTVSFWFHSKSITGADNFENIENAKEKAFVWIESEMKNIIDYLSAKE